MIKKNVRTFNSFDLLKSFKLLSNYLLSFANSVNLAIATNKAKRKCLFLSHTENLFKNSMKC